jgi:hypothetical protein
MAEERHSHEQDFPYHEQRVENGLVQHEVFAAGFENGEIVHPSSRIDYTYDGSSLIGESITASDEDGNVVSTVNYEWYTESVTNKISIRRKVRV